MRLRNKRAPKSMQKTKILEVPKRLHPISDIHDRVDNEFNEAPFFGFAPSETPVRVINCPDCGRPVSAAHLHLHRSTHEIAKQITMQRNENFKFPVSSKLLPSVPCPYSERQSYTFKHLIDSDAK